SANLIAYTPERFPRPSLPHLARSSSGPGRHPLKVEIAGSNPARVTQKQIQNRPRRAVLLCPWARTVHISVQIGFLVASAAQTALYPLSSQRGGRTSAGLAAFAERLASARRVEQPRFAAPRKGQQRGSAATHRGQPGDTPSARWQSGHSDVAAEIS